MAVKRVVRELFDMAVEDSRRRYRGTLRFDSRLPIEVPWQVRAMWHDERSSNPQ